MIDEDRARRLIAAEDAAIETRQRIGRRMEAELSMDADALEQAREESGTVEDGFLDVQALELLQCLITVNGPTIYLNMEVTRTQDDERYLSDAWFTHSHGAGTGRADIWRDTPEWQWCEQYMEMFYDGRD